MLRLTTILILLGTLCLTGCRQPNVQGVNRPLFSWGQPNYNNSAGQYRNNGTGGQYNPAFAGQGQNPNFNPNFNPNLNQGGSPEQYQQFANLTEEVRSLNGRLGRFDSDNQQLVTELAAMKQKLQVANDYNYQIKQQLADQTGQMQQLQMEKAAGDQQFANVQFQLEQLGQSNGELQQRLASAQQSQFSQASTGGGGSRFASATLRANNSLMQKLPQIQIPGVETRMDGDVIRIEIPTDQLFHQGSYQINAAHSHLLQNLSNSIRQNFPRQIIGIEAHWDGTQVQPTTTTHHQLTATQALAVFDYMSKLGLPRNQMFTMAMGSNRLRHPTTNNDGGINKNRRIEVVIYPETYDGS